MSQIAAKNEHVRAVGNMKVNARGDTIDSNGNVVVPVTRKVSNSYQKTVSNRAANVIKQREKPVEAESIQVDPIPQVEEEIEEVELLEEELEFEDDDEADEIEALKAAEYTIKPASEAPDFYDPRSEEKTKKK